MAVLTDAQYTTFFNCLRKSIETFYDLENWQQVTLVTWRQQVSDIFGSEDLEHLLPDFPGQFDTALVQIDQTKAQIIIWVEALLEYYGRDILFVDDAANAEAVLRALGESMSADSKQILDRVTAIDSLDRGSYSEVVADVGKIEPADGTGGYTNIGSTQLVYSFIPPVQQIATERSKAEGMQCTCIGASTALSEVFQLSGAPSQSRESYLSEGSGAGPSLTVAGKSIQNGWFDDWTGNAADNWVVDQDTDANQTNTTYSFVDGGASPDTVIDSAGQFVIDGFTAGATLTVIDSVSNDGTYTLDTVVAGTITLIASDSLTTEAAGTSITLKTGAWATQIIKETSTVYRGTNSLKIDTTFNTKVLIANGAYLSLDGNSVYAVGIWVYIPAALTAGTLTFRFGTWDSTTWVDKIASAAIDLAHADWNTDAWNFIYAAFDTNGQVPANWYLGIEPTSLDQAIYVVGLQYTAMSEHNGIYFGAFAGELDAALSDRFGDQGNSRGFVVTGEGPPSDGGLIQYYLGRWFGISLPSGDPASPAPADCTDPVLT